MHSRYSHTLRTISIIVLSFFIWTFGGVFEVAYAVKDRDTSSVKSDERKHRNITPPNLPLPQVEVKRSEEKFSKAVEDIENILKDDKADHDFKRQRIRSKKAEIEAHDIEIRKQFTETEGKIKDLPEVIKKRHRDFVKHYDDNLRELKANLDDIDKAKTDTEREHAHRKAKAHLEKVKPPKKHRALDPNKLPHRTEEPVFKEPRTKPEEFTEGKELRAENTTPLNPPLVRRDVKSSQPILLAMNGEPTGLLNSTPPPQAPPYQGGETGEVSLPKGSYQLALANPPTTADLAEDGIEIVFTPAIRAKAAELGYKPVKIYEWVRNNIEYVPTYGSIQGADMCLQTKQCNDMDTASLLIALFRVSGIHARYVYGTIELPIEKVKNWAGGFTDTMSALGLLASAGIPTKGMTVGGEIKHARLEHTWVEAWIDMIPSMGAVHKQGNTWIPLDASFKQYAYTQGLDIKTAVPFDAQAFVEQIKNTATVNEAQGYVTNVNSLLVQQTMQNYQSRVQSYISQNYPNATVGDVLGKKEVVKEEYPYLLGTPPYETIVKGATYSNIPDSKRHKIIFSVVKDLYDSEIGTPINITKNLPELAGKKLTLSYSPATPQDEVVINSYLPKPHADGTPIQPNELPSSLPVYLVNLKPELRIDGQVVATGTPVTMGMTEKFDMTFIEPMRGHDIISNFIQAGEYLGIAIEVSQMSREVMEIAEKRFASAKSKIAAQDFMRLSHDDILGEVLFITAQLYNLRVEGYDSVLAYSLGVRTVRTPSETIFQTVLDVRTFFGIPLSASSGGLMMDADRNNSFVKALDGSGNNVQFMYYSGINASALEHLVPEQLFGPIDTSVQGVSAVKALQIANDAAIPIYTVTKNNIDIILPTLQLEFSVIDDIRNAVNTGKEVIVSKTNINYHGWIGCGYIVVDPATGGGAYMISDGASGAFILGLVGFPMWAYLSTTVEAFKLLCIKFFGFEVMEPKDWCGSEGSEMVPDYPIGVDARWACKIHDECYVAAQSEWAKMSCDVELGVNVFFSCVAQGREVIMCQTVGATYGVAVLLFGWKAWRNAR